MLSHYSYLYTYILYSLSPAQQPATIHIPLKIYIDICKYLIYNFFFFYLALTLVFPNQVIFLGLIYSDTVITLGNSKSMLFILKPIL